MADLNAFLAAVKVDVDAAVSGITSVVGWTDPSTLASKARFPWATIFDPTETNATASWRQFTRTRTCRVVYVRAAGEFSEADDDLALIVAELTTAPYLADATIRDLYVSQAAIAEVVDEKGRLRAALEITTMEEV